MRRSFLVNGLRVEFPEGINDATTPPPEGGCVLLSSLSGVTGRRILTPNENSVHSLCDSGDCRGRSLIQGPIMRIQGCALASVTVFILFLTVPTFGRKLPHKQHKHGHLERSKEIDESVQSGKNKDAPNYLNSHKEKEECHKAALHKCGQTFLRAHKLLTYLEDDLVAFRTRCGVRTAFFECMKTTREKICSRSSQYKHVFKVETDFRKKLTDALWATRVCVLGVKALKGL